MMPQGPEDHVGIAAIGCYIPKGSLSSDEIARRAGIPVEVLTKKIGMQRKPEAEAAEQPSEMAFAAARVALEKASISPDDLDLIIYCGSTPQDYLLWSSSAKLQHMLGACNAFAFEVTNGCNGMSIGMKVARDMLLQNRAWRHALVGCADKYSPFIDYTGPDDVSVFHMADGAAAVVLRRNERTNAIVSYFQMTDGSYSDFVKIRNGGTMHPYSGREALGRQSLSVESARELSSTLAETYRSSYIAAIRSALEQCGRTVEDIDFLFTSQVAASMMSSILDALRIPPEKTFRSLDGFGHMGSVDAVFALSLFLDAGRIAPGSLVALATSAIGFSWAAMVLQF